MKVTCPHCAANYNIDDRRIPSSGLNVKCPKCSAAFPVKREAEPPPPPPADDQPFSFGQQPGAVPLPAPENPFAAPPPADDQPFSFGQQPASVPLPAPDNPFAQGP